MIILLNNLNLLNVIIDIYLRESRCWKGEGWTRDAETIPGIYEKEPESLKKENTMIKTTISTDGL